MGSFRVGLNLGERKTGALREPGWRQSENFAEDSYLGRISVAMMYVGKQIGYWSWITQVSRRLLCVFSHSLFLSMLKHFFSVSLILIFGYDIVYLCMWAVID
ncbi:hypothetical protein ACP275_04G156200 [Erythranthe tilingii]